MAANVECAFCGGPTAGYEIDGDPACKACRKNYEKDEVECHTCGKIFYDAQPNVIQVQKEIWYPIEDACEAEYADVCESCWIEEDRPCDC